MQSRPIVEELCRRGITHVVGLPDNGTRALFDALWADERIEVVSVTREGEAFALASGLHIGGRRAVVLIQGTGLLEAGDALRGTAVNMAIPLVSFIGYRGYASLNGAAEKRDTAAAFLEPTLDAWNIPYAVVCGDEDVARVGAVFDRAERECRPGAVLLAGVTE